MNIIHEYSVSKSTNDVQPLIYHDDNILMIEGWYGRW